MAFNVITFLQMTVFVVILFSINLHSTSAGSEESSDPYSFLNSIEVEVCDTNCTKGADGVWSKCNGGCKCAPLGNSTEGLCVNIGDFDFPSPEAEV
ncbi:evasin P1074-like [Ixodes scapularis]|uniref:evasin P1074-like n=1 Tax=Ixodes scapularis TaxID=6945 RepID=UPI001C38F2AE|nr:evasin P1074-like [Ixodes scapularis]